MNPELENPEEILLCLQPSVMPQALFDRLEAAMDQSSTDVRSERENSAGPEDFELPTDEEVIRSLNGLEPKLLSPELIDRLDHAMSHWHRDVPESEKIIPMRAASFRSGRPSKSWMSWPSAAAVAVLGTGLAFVAVDEPAPGGESIPVASAGTVAPPKVRDQVVPLSRSSASGGGVQITPVGSGSPAKVVSAAGNVFTPVTAAPEVRRATDQGVFRTKDGKFVRCLELEIQKRVSFENPNGETLTLECPHRNVYLAPLSVD